MFRLSHPRFLLLLLLLAFGFIPTVCLGAGPTASEYGVVLNLSGKQRMLTQKMSKEVMLIALNVDTDKNLQNLTATAALFDKTLKGLRDGDASLNLPPTTSKRIIKQLDKINTRHWQGFNKTIQEILAAKTVSKAQVQLIATANLPLLKQMNKCVKLYEKDASSAGLKADPGLAVTINLAGKQRMLTQKMSKEFLLVAYGYDTENNKLNLFETATLFERTLQGLQNGDPTLDLPGTSNNAIRAQLQVVTKLWTAFKPIIEKAATSETLPTADEINILAHQNLPLLKEMNKSVKMFEKEAS
jgi:hypothetical protein